MSQLEREKFSLAKGLADLEMLVSRKEAEAQRRKEYLDKVEREGQREDFEVDSTA